MGAGVALEPQPCTIVVDDAPYEHLPVVGISRLTLRTPLVWTGRHAQRSH